MYAGLYKVVNKNSRHYGKIGFLVFNTNKMEALGNIEGHVGHAGNDMEHPAQICQNHWTN